MSRFDVLVLIKPRKSLSHDDTVDVSFSRSCCFFVVVVVVFVVVVNVVVAVDVFAVVVVVEPRWRRDFEQRWLSCFYCIGSKSSGRDGNVNR